MQHEQDALPDPLFNVAGKNILVVGTGGFGRPIIEMLQRRGASVATFDARPSELNTVDKAGNRMPSGTVDITVASSIQQMFDEVLSQFDRIDGMVNAAGVLLTAPAMELSEQDFQRSLDINLKGAFLLSRHLAEVMAGQDGGRIVHIASVSSQVANRDYAAYAASKGGLSQLIRVLGREWAQDNVLINAIGPSMAATAMTSDTFSSERKRTSALAQIPMGRFCMPEDILGMALLLLSEAGGYITGQTIYVDGGRTLV